MPLFGTEEWVQAYITQLNSNEAYAEAAQNWEGDFIFIIRKDSTLDHDLFLWIDLWHGKARGGKSLNSAEDMDTAYTFEGPYENYVKLVEGTLDPIKGLITGNFKLKGNIAKVMRAVKAAQELVHTIQLTETEFY